MQEKDRLDAIDWSLTTFEGARREQMRRWAELPLERMVASLEELESIGRALTESSATHACVLTPPASDSRD